MQQSTQLLCAKNMTRDNSVPCVTDSDTYD